MSMTSDSDGVISGNVSPGSFSMLGSNTLSISSNCPDGYYVYVTGNEDNKLYLNGESSHESTAFSTSSGTIANPAPLNIAEWGIAFESNASLFMGVTSIDVAIRTPQDYIDTNGEGNYDTNEEDISLYYGIRAGTYHVAGTYTSPNNQATVTYSLVPSLKCVSVTFQFDAGSLGEGANPEVTGSMEDFEASYGALVAFPESGFSRTNYNFAGWSTKDNDDPDNQDESELHFLGDGTDELIDETVIYNRTDAGVLTLYPMWRLSKTYIQNWKGCANLSVGDVATLYDNRDEQAYRVAKWKMTADGSKTKCWMMDNLNLGAVTLETDLTSENTNLLDDIPAATFNGWKGTSGTTSYTTGRFITRTTSDTYGNNYGVLYNYYVASAKTITGTSNSVNATSDICPAGWRLPTGNTSGEFAQLVSAYSLSGSTGVTSLKRDFGFPAAGYTSSGSVTGAGSSGYYWSSTYGGAVSTMYRLNFTSTTITSTSTSSRYYTSSIKCIAMDKAKITFNKNDVNASGDMNSLMVEVGETATLPQNSFSKQDYVFMGWNTASNGSGTSYADGDTITPASANDITLYAQWKAAADFSTNVTLTNTNATTTGSTAVTVNYGDNAATITNPARTYTVSGFSLTSSASGATITGSTSTRTSTYTFDGWYTASSGGTKIITDSGAFVASTDYTDDSGNWKSIEPELTLYAHWTGGSVSLPTISKSGYTCGWKTGSSTPYVPSYSSSTMAPTSNTVLYGVCYQNTFDGVYLAYGKTKTNGYYTMQDMSQAICSHVGDSKTGTLVDTRGSSNTYSVAKINNRCWMTQNLKASSVPAGTLSSATTNITADKTLSWYGVTTSDDYTKARRNGEYVNYAGATAETITGSSNTTGTSQSICPKNWMLPSSSEFARISNNSTYKSLFNPTSNGGFYDGEGTFHSGSSYWWTATSYNATERRVVAYDGGTTLSDGVTHVRVAAIFIRCMARY